MKRKIMILSCSPKETKGNSYAIAAYLKQQIDKFECTSSIFTLGKSSENFEDMLFELKQSDVLILSIPIYENMVPGSLIHFFEEVYAECGQFNNKPHQLFVITNSGFAKTEANTSAIAICKAFADSMKFQWLGGIAVAPGTLIDNDDLLASKKTYKNLLKAIDIISQSIAENSKIPDQVFELSSHTFIPNLIYVVAGYLMQKGNIKRLGKSSYFAQPLI